MTLAPKKFIFAQNYMIDRNATQAAIRAGYSEKTAYAQGSRLLKDAEVAAWIEQASKEQEQRTKIDADWVLTKLTTVVERCLQEEAVRDRDGNPTGEFVFNASGANKALELISKHREVMAMGSDKLELTGKDGAPLELSDAERTNRLLAIVAAGNARKEKK